MAAPVVDEQATLPRYISEQFEGGPRFGTLILATRSGFEQRFKTQSRPRYYYSLSADKQTLPMLADLEAFFLTHDGAFEGFRLFDIADNTVSVPTDTLQLSPTTYQITKRYVSGSRTRVRELTKLEAGSVQVFNQSSVEVTSGFTVDTTTGILTFSSAPGYLPKAITEFYVPVRFTKDSLTRIMTAPTYGSLDSLDCIELLN